MYSLRVEPKMNAVYEYFFPQTTMDAPKPATVPPKPKTVRVCFTRGNSMYTLTLKDVESMTDTEIKKWRNMILSHCYETYDPEECENADLILKAMDARLTKTDSSKPDPTVVATAPTTD